MSADLDEQFRVVLNVFVYRARRIENHSLTADKQALLALATKRFTIEFEAEPEPRTWLVVELPPEEAMESLATRCRPFVLDGDVVHYPKVLEAFGYYLRTDAELAAVVTEQREKWKRLRRNVQGSLGYSVRTGPVGGGLGLAVTDRELAYRWLYGDLVHADDLSDMDHNLTSRYEAGVMLTANVAVLVISLLNLLRQARDRGLIEVPDPLLTQEVAAETSRRRQVQAVTGPVGTALKVLEAALDEVTKGGPARPAPGGPK